MDPISVSNINITGSHACDGGINIIIGSITTSNRSSAMFVHNVSVFLLFASTETTPAGKSVYTAYCLFTKTMTQLRK